MSIRWIVYGFEVFCILVISFGLLIKAPKPQPFFRMNNAEIGGSKEYYFGSNFDLTEENEMAQDFITESVRYYIDNCLGSDYLQPLSGECINTSGIGIFAIDSLDTLIISGSAKEFLQIKEWVDNSFTCRIDSFISTHDLITHIIGGLISAYSLTGDSAFLDHASECYYVLRESISKPIPAPLINAQRHTARQYAWANGTTLSDAGAFQLELQSLSDLLDDPSINDHVSNLQQCTYSLLKRGEIPETLSVGKCSSSTNLSGFSSLSASFFVNALRSYIYRPTPENTAIKEWLIAYLEHNEISNISNGFFDSSFCQLVPLFHSLNVSLSFVNDLTGLCQDAADDVLPMSYSKFDKEGKIDLEMNSFDFDSSLLEDSLLNDGTFDSIYFLHLIDRVRTKNGVSSLLTQNPPIYGNVQWGESISRWLKLLYLERHHLKYDEFIFNEAGHLIPIINN